MDLFVNNRSDTNFQSGEFDQEILYSGILSFGKVSQRLPMTVSSAERFNM